MRPITAKRHVWLLLLAILVPSGGLVWLGVRLVGQERELDRQREIALRRQISSRVGSEIVSSLDRLKLQEASAMAARDFEFAPRYQNPAVRLVGLMRDGRLILPWETRSASHRVLITASDSAFVAAMESGENAEYLESDIERASSHYARAVELAARASQRDHARLLLARSLYRRGRPGQAAPVARALLSSTTEDELGLPLALYAARMLQRHGALPTDTATATLSLMLERGATLPPPAHYLVRDIARDAMSEASAPDDIARFREMLGVTDSLASDAAQARALQAHFSRSPIAGPVRVDSRSEWVTFEGWLIAATRPAGGYDGVLVAVDPRSVIERVEREISQTGLAGPIEVRPASESDLTIPELADLGVTFLEPSEAASTSLGLRESFYLKALLFVLAVTMIGGYLLWRDVRRELHLAELRSQFVSAVSHELKTPLTSIRMFAETLQMQNDIGDGRKNEYLDTIINESQRLTRLLNNVLEFSRIEHGGSRLDPGLNSIPEIVRTSARAMRYPARQEGFSLNVVIDDEIPAAEVDRDALEQAILNLLSNAMKFSGASREIDLRLRKSEDHAVIEVSDHGIGIDAEEQDKVFDRFYRSGATESEGAPGAGLGLTLVRHIAEAHGGRVEVESRVGVGSTFAIHIPLNGSSA